MYYRILGNFRGKIISLFFRISFKPRKFSYTNIFQCMQLIIIIILQAITPAKCPLRGAFSYISSAHSITNSKHRHRLRGCLSDVKLVATGFNGKTYKELDVFPSSYVLGLFRTRPHRQGDCQASSFSDQLYVDNVTLRLSGTSFPPDRTALPNFMFAI